MKISDYKISKKDTSSMQHDSEELRTAEVSFNKGISSTGHDPQKLRTAEIHYIEVFEVFHATANAAPSTNVQNVSQNASNSINTNYSIL